jgi:hypothetical protein
MSQIVLITGAKGGLGAHVAGGFAYGGPIQETGDAVWDQMMDLNARAAFHVLRAAIPRMRERGSGRIVAIGSRAGVEPQANIAAYAASKAALVSLVRTAALENRDLGITANVILPGTIDTEANRKADPVLLEPIMKVEVVTPEEYMGNVVGDLNSRRGQIDEMSHRGNAKVIDAKVPLAEMFGYVTELRSMSQGRATSTMEFFEYKEVPRNVLEKIKEGKSGTSK